MSVNDLAVSEGLRLARLVFKKRGNHLEAHLREEELAVLLAVAFKVGAASKETKA